MLIVKFWGYLIITDFCLIALDLVLKSYFKRIIKMPTLIGSFSKIRVLYLVFIKSVLADKEGRCESRQDNSHYELFCRLKMSHIFNHNILNMFFTEANI